MKEYFWLTQDTRLALFDAVIFNSIVSMQSKVSGQLNHLKRLTLFEAAFSIKENLRFDVFDRELFMVSKKIEELFELFIPNMEYREVCIADSQQKRMHYFYLPLLQLFEMKAETIYIPENNPQKTLKLFCNHDIETEIIKVKSSSSKFVVVSLMVAEAILRMNSENVRLIPVEIVHE